MPEARRQEMVLSYHRVRTALGVLGMALPMVLLVGGLLDFRRIEPSISDFYHTTYRDIFVGTLCAIGVFLICYRGYRRVPGDIINDDWLGTVAGVAAFGVALFPNESPTAEIATMTQELVGIGISPIFHYTSALVFFCSLAVFCLFKFARTRHRLRRRIYIGCGLIIVAALIGITLASYAKVMGAPEQRQMVAAYNLVFWFEAIGIWAFGLSWLVKGKADSAFVRLANRVAEHRDPLLR
ncbi:hypothetical protein [Loktanella sp. S4079]|uniref:hypothetical protein n=1 Tax=Loktanella sp. S4079 TaxID=579483 RepID=UPI0006983C5D|nr:hypothetical protein [Loktanella sp. S4079]